MQLTITILRKLSSSGGVSTLMDKRFAAQFSAIRTERIIREIRRKREFALMAVDYVNEFVVSSSTFAPPPLPQLFHDSGPRIAPRTSSLALTKSLWIKSPKEVSQLSSLGPRTQAMYPTPFAGNLNRDRQAHVFVSRVRVGPTNLGKRERDVLFRGQGCATLIKGKSGRRRAAGVPRPCRRKYLRRILHSLSGCRGVCSVYVLILCIYELGCVPGETEFCAGIRTHRVIFAETLAAAR